MYFVLTQIEYHLKIDCNKDFRLGILKAEIHGILNSVKFGCINILWSKKINGTLGVNSA